MAAEYVTLSQFPPQTKRCSHCREEKSAEAFVKDASRKDGLYAFCRVCRAKTRAVSRKVHPEKERARNRAYYKTHPERVRQKRYGLTPASFDALLAAQDGKCKICCTPLTPCLPRSLHVDHCHTTGQVRGLLCRPCNHGLGNFKDDPARCARASQYLKDCAHGAVLTA